MQFSLILPVYSTSPIPADVMGGQVALSEEYTHLLRAWLSFMLFSACKLGPYSPWSFFLEGSMSLCPPSQPILRPCYYRVLCLEIHWWDFRLITEFILTTLLGICVQSTWTCFLLFNLHNSLWIGRMGVILHFMIRILDQSHLCDLPKIPE